MILRRQNSGRERLRVAVLGLRGIPEVPGGIEKHCDELYTRLAKNNLKVTLIVRKGYVNSQPHIYQGVKLVPLWAPKNKNLETICHSALGIFWLARHKKQFDILHIHAIGPSLFAPLARWLGFRVIITSHGSDYERQKWGVMAKLVLKMGEKIGVSCAHEVIAVSEQIKQNLQRLYRCEAYFIPNGANLACHGNDGLFLKRFGLRSGEYLLAVGRLVPEKGFHDLLEAYVKLKPDWHLVIAGCAIYEDTYSRKLHKMANRIPSVVMTGFLKSKELDEFYSHARLFVLPSYHEGLPIALLEAMSYGLPVLVSDIPANKEVDLPDERFFKCGDVDDLRGKIQDLINQDMSTEEKEAMRRQVAEKYNWDRIAEQTIEVYEKALG